MPSPYTTHVCLVSDQATPNLIPFLDPVFRPATVVLVVSADMRARAQALAEVIRPLGVVVNEVTVADPWNLRLLEEEFLTLLAAHETENIAVNISGGTKPMAIAAQKVFSENNRPVFFVHPQRDEIVFVGAAEVPYHLHNTLRISQYLTAHGYGMTSGDRTARLARGERELTQTLIREHARFGHALGYLNYLAGSAKKDKALASDEIEARSGSNVDFLELLDLFGGAGLLVREASRLVFADEAARFHVNGGWLEHHVFGVVSDLRGPCAIQDVLLNVQVTHPGGTRNELDVAVLAGNRLSLIECKTRSFRPRDGLEPAADALYKLDSLTALGGLRTRGMLVSYQPLKDFEEQRAKDLGIKPVVGGSLARLPEILSQWLGPR
jgi:hypothetical protein